MPGRDQLDRWLASEAEEREEAADAAFARLFEAVPKVEPGAAFVGSTVARVWRARTRRRRATAIGWVAAALVATAAGVAGYAAAVPAGAWTVKTGVVLASGAMPWLVAYATEAMNLWWVVAQIGGHIATAVATPPRAAALVAVEVVGICAFVALHRLVRSEYRGEAQI